MSNYRGLRLVGLKNLCLAGSGRRCVMGQLTVAVITVGVSCLLSAHGADILTTISVNSAVCEYVYTHS